MSQNVTAVPDLYHGCRRSNRIQSLHRCRQSSHPSQRGTPQTLLPCPIHQRIGQCASWLLARHLSTNEDSNEVDDNGKFVDNVKHVFLMLRYHTTADRGFITNL